MLVKIENVSPNVYSSFLDELDQYFTVRTPLHTYIYTYIYTHIYTYVYHIRLRDAYYVAINNYFNLVSVAAVMVICTCKMS